MSPVLVGRWKRQRTLQLPTGESFTPRPAPHFLARFRCAQHVLGGEIDFLMDTGADITTIMPDDRDAICIPGRAMVDGCPSAMRGIGGAVPLRYVQGVTLQFLGADGHALEPIALDRIGVLCVPLEIRPSYKGVPSLLGRDFLERGKLSLSASGVTIEC